MLTIYPEKQHPDAAKFCHDFLQNKKGPRYVLGRNEYAVSIANSVDLIGFIDDFTSETEFLGKSIYKMKEIPHESLVVSAVIFVVPLTALNKLKNHGLIGLDYFMFMKYSGLDLKQIDFLREGKEDIEKNLEKYNLIYKLMSDDKSKDILERLVNFRYSYDLDYMTVFEYTPDHQYFEDFLALEPGEVFVDAGGFDGQTSLEFIRRCPDYKSIHIFDPDPKNLALARNNLSEHKNITFHATGLADCRTTLRFSSGGGSASKVSATGDLEIQVDTIDNLVEEPISFIKMDIEGAEGIALEGARSHILNDHPKLAICCYHKYDDLWRIPEQILSIRDDYSLYLRHYTDGLHETVMFFMPRV